jgi:hypothetical protein
MGFAGDLVVGVEEGPGEQVGYERATLAVGAAR